MDAATIELIAEMAARERMEKKAEAVRRIYFLLDKAEDDIQRYTSVLAGLNDQRDEIEALLRSVCEKISDREFDPHLDPRNDAGMEIFASEYSSPSGFLRYMEKAEKVNETGKKSLAAELEKLKRQRSALRSKLDSLDARIYATEQRIKKAEYERFEYSEKLK